MLPLFVSDPFLVSKTAIISSKIVWCTLSGVLKQVYPMLGNFLSCTFSETLKRVFFFSKGFILYPFPDSRAGVPYTEGANFFFFFFFFFWVYRRSFKRVYPFRKPLRCTLSAFLEQVCLMLKHFGVPFPEFQTTSSSVLWSSLSAALKRVYPFRKFFFVCVCVMYPLRSSKEALFMMELTAEYLFSSSGTVVSHA